MSLKNVRMAQCLRGHGFEERKRVLLEQIWLPGRLMEGLFSLSGSSCFMARFDFHSWGVKVGAAPRRSKGVLLCLSLLSFQRERLCLVDIAASPYAPLLLPRVSPLSINPDSPTAVASLPRAPFCYSMPGRQQATMAALTTPATDKHALVWQIPRHFTDQRLSQI